jgi:hypothetical protein
MTCCFYMFLQYFSENIYPLLLQTVSVSSSDQGKQVKSSAGPMTSSLYRQATYINRTTSNIFPWKSWNWWEISFSRGFQQKAEISIDLSASIVPALCARNQTPGPMRHWSPPGLEWGVGRSPQSLNSVDSMGDFVEKSWDETNRWGNENGDRMGYDLLD